MDKRDNIMVKKQIRQAKIMNEKRVRISDIADELGLSTATVSNVIHGKTKKISAETVKHVQQLLEERQYIPSMAGILLAQNNSRIIGVVINNHEKYEGHVLEDVFIASSLNHLSTEIEENGNFMMVKTTTEDSEIVKFASMWNLDGVVLIGFSGEEFCQKLRENMHIPLVVYDGYFTKADRLCNLVIDNYDGGMQVGRYFKECGHERALCILDNEISTDLERRQGFLCGFGEGADFMLIPMQQEKRHKFYEEHLEKIKQYTAIFAASDYYALDMMQFLLARGIRVPEDISIAGFDDNPICKQVVPALTTVKQDGKERARLAIEMLTNLKKGDAGQVIKLPVTLVKRDSTTVCTKK